MVIVTSNQNTILASVSDTDIPCERVISKTARGHQKRRADRFLKGPIPFSWIRNHVIGSTDRLLLVLKAHSDMLGTDKLKLTADILHDAGIDNRKAAYRAINRLEANGTLTVVRKRGRRPILSLGREPK